MKSFFKLISYIYLKRLFEVQGDFISFLKKKKKKKIMEDYLDEIG